MYKPKVVHIVEDLRIGGLEKIIANIVLGLDKSKYKVEVWCLAGGGEIADELMAKGVVLKILEMDSYYNPFKVTALAGILRKKNVVILHTHGYFAGTFGRLAAILARIPIIITHVHTTYYDFKKRNILMERFLSLFTNKIVCVSRAVERFVVDIEGISGKRTCLIYNGIEKYNLFEGITASDEERDSLGFVENDLVVITVASLTAHKGHRILMEAFRIVLEKNRSLKLLIVGDGYLRNELESYSNKYGIASSIVFAGQRKNVASLLKLANIFVLPSTEREGLGIALIEAMAAGLPVIGTRLGGIPEVISENINGLLVAPGNPYELASAMETLTRDQAMREKMGKMGRKIYEEKFSASKMIQNMDSLYGELMEKRLR